MNKIYRYTTLFIMLMSFQTQAITVLSSVKPIHLVVQELTDGVAESSYLVPNGASPHDYALRPSDIKKLKSADLIFWYGTDLEAFLSKILSEQDNVITISDFSSVEFYHYEESHDDEHDDDSGHHEDSHNGHQGHHHSTDPHFWLGPKVVLDVAKQITLQLISYDSLNKQKYESNLIAFEKKLTQEVENISAELEPVTHEGYFVFHDAYGYFERYFGMNHLGHFTVNPNRKPGAKTLIKIKDTLVENKAKCVFSDAQFKSAMVTTILQGTEAKSGVLDPLAIDIPDEKGGYFLFLSTISSELLRCLN